MKIGRPSRFSFAIGALLVLASAQAVQAWIALRRAVAEDIALWPASWSWSYIVSEPAAGTDNLMITDMNAHDGGNLPEPRSPLDFYEPAEDATRPLSRSVPPINSQSPGNDM